MPDLSSSTSVRSKVHPSVVVSAMEIRIYEHGFDLTHGPGIPAVYYSNSNWELVSPPLPEIIGTNILATVSHTLSNEEVVESREIHLVLLENGRWWVVDFNQLVEGVAQRLIHPTKIDPHSVEILFVPQSRPLVSEGSNAFGD